jgi:predicted ATP-dependent protease
MKELEARDVGIPEFDAVPAPGSMAFDLSSHSRAGAALALGLDTPGTDYNIYVIGPDRSGRMTATRDFVESWVAGRAPSDDWVYVLDFARPSTPKPMQLPPGMGRRLKASLEGIIPTLGRELAAALRSEDHQRQLGELKAHGEASVQARLRELEAEAQRDGLSILNTPQGAVVAALRDDGSPEPLNLLPVERRTELEERSRSVLERMAEINRDAARLQRRYFDTVRELNRDIAVRATEGLLDGLAETFADLAEVSAWLGDLRADVADHYELFLSEEAGMLSARSEPAQRRYCVNLLVDRGGTDRPPVVIEQNPSYENLFGLIEYRQLPGGGLETDVGLVQPGALHRANGGVLILRAEALVAQPLLWGYLKAALRDGEIRIEEFYRANSPPIAGAPKPVPVPLDLNVVMVGAPQWYYAFFAVDPEFQLYFKVKAEIEATVDATPENLACYAGLVAGAAERLGVTLAADAMPRLLGLSARWAGHRKRLTSSFEMANDVLIEAARIAGAGVAVTAEHTRQAVATRRQRNGQMEDRVHRSIQDKMILIQTAGEVVGQINGLTVQSPGDHTFGTPARITARCSVGRRGVINIERLVAMSGPIQQKGSMALQGILMRKFAQRFPLSFDCSVTFEQLYGAVEGDSASMAEFVAIISELADLPVRQDLAITGSINQLGEAQVIGGVHHKVEGFYRACLSCGALTGTQGVIIPSHNEVNLIVRDELRDALADGRFHVYSVARVEEAIELFMGYPAGQPDSGGEYPADSVYGRVMERLRGFDEALAERRTNTRTGEPI